MLPQFSVRYALKEPSPVKIHHFSIVYNKVTDLQPRCTHISSFHSLSEMYKIAMLNIINETQNDKKDKHGMIR